MIWLALLVVVPVWVLIVSVHSVRAEGGQFEGTDMHEKPKDVVVDWF